MALTNSGLDSGLKSNLQQWVQNRWLVYLIAWLLINSTLAAITLLYLKKSPPSYVSTWSISLPGASTTTNVNLPGIAQASSSNTSPYISEFSDPRETYKFLAATPEVIALAAAQVQMSTGQFGRAEINVIDNTTLMTFEMGGSSPEEARKKAIALQKALETHLNKLRREEIKQSNATLQTVLQDSEQKLDSAQQQLFGYKSRSGLTSPQQIDQITTNVEQLWQKQAEVMAQMQQTNAELQELAGVLGLTPEQAADALTLQSDQLFQQYLGAYSRVTAELSTLRVSLTSVHPTILRKSSEKTALEAALLRQARILLRKPVNLSTLSRLNLHQEDSSPQRAALFQQLIGLSSQRRGLQNQAAELQRQIGRSQGRLSGLAQKESQLDALQRDVQIAEAIFSSTLTKLDLSQGQISASYPAISVVSQPTLPQGAITSKYVYLALGTPAASFFVTTGLLAMKLRNQKRNQKQIAALPGSVS